MNPINGCQCPAVAIVTFRPPLFWTFHLFYLLFSFSFIQIGYSRSVGWLATRLFRLLPVYSSRLSPPSWLPSKQTGNCFSIQPLLSPLWLLLFSSLRTHTYCVRPAHWRSWVADTWTDADIWYNDTKPHFLPSSRTKWNSKQQENFEKKMGKFLRSGI